MKITRGPLAAAVLVAGAVLAAPPATAVGTTYYVDNRNLAACDDDGPGNATTPWCTFTPVNEHADTIGFGPGDSILLARGATWDRWLDLTGSGTAAEPITLGAFGTGDRPKITNSDIANSGYGVRLTSGSHWVIKDLEIDGAGADKFDAGIQVLYNTVGHVGLTLSNLYVHHNWMGIAISGAAAPAAGQWAIKDVTITGVEGTHNERSIALGKGGAPSWFVQDALISKVYLHDDDGEGLPRDEDCRDTLALQSATRVLVTNSVITGAGGCYARAGTTAVYLGRVADSTLLNNIIVDTPDTGSPDQTGIDYEAGTSNVGVRGNLLSGHARWGVEVLGRHPSPAGDHTGVAIDSNAIVFNGGSAIARMLSESTASGTIDRNLWQGNALVWVDDATMDLTVGSQGVNPGPVTGGRVWYAGRDYAGTQGAGGWRYEYSANASVTWSPLTHISAAQGWRPAANALPLINQWGMHPAIGTSTRVARVWTAPTNGTIAISGQAAKGVTGGDGIRIHVLKTTPSGTNTVVLGPLAIGANDLIGKPTAVPSLQVAAGDVIRFVVDAGTAGDNSYDNVNWSPAIGYL
ncbi:right-handed parallel beta-helix repeat-containing protein [Jiangella rhizosphaerae]|uniref:Uncharacterized protein n=1 Tax=Jiangella rhizosphaerae TaxID=2293569 RepID=A0A418KVA0_9ACTN|nr:right-handed parallel beta-helix repeat-containing protein [Jiangella rhizosphaerae]RIQ33698.1 hypothetical protein DY240_04655 [Jiangella rhizosphaerae]